MQEEEQEEREREEMDCHLLFGARLEPIAGSPLQPTWIQRRNGTFDRPWREECIEAGPPLLI